METADQLDQGGFTRPRLTHQRYGLAGLNLKIDIFQHRRWVIGIIEKDMLEAYFAPDGRQLYGTPGSSSTSIGVSSSPKMRSLLAMVDWNES